MTTVTSPVHPLLPIVTSSQQPSKHGTTLQLINDHRWSAPSTDIFLVDKEPFHMPCHEYMKIISPPRCNNDQAHDPYITTEEGTDLKLSNVDPPQMSVDGGIICPG